MDILSGSGFDESTRVYSSKLPRVKLPEDFGMGFTEHIFNKISENKCSEKVAMVDATTGTTVSYKRMKGHVLALAKGLVDLGVTKGGVVLLLAPNSVEFVIVVLAVLLLGGIVTATNPDHPGPELDKQLRSSNIVLVFTTAKIATKLWHQTDLLSLPTILIGDGHHDNTLNEKFITLSDILKENAGGMVIPEIVCQDDTAVILYSSGTSGVSKGVLISHRNLMAFATIYNANPLVGHMVNDVYACMIPQFHIYGLAVVTLAQLVRGASIITLPPVPLKEMIINVLEAVHNYRVTHLPLVPSILLHLVDQSSETLSKYDLGSLTHISCGAASLSRELIERCLQKFPKVILQQGYGMSESINISQGTTSPSNPICFGSVGLLAASIEAKVVDVDSKMSLPPNEIGELWVRSPQNMKGYLKNEEATNEVIDKEGWLHTGDLVYFNHEGYLFIFDRIKELIKCNGFQVAPAELEALLNAHTDIVEAAVIPCPDEVAGEIPLAFVVKKPGSNLTETGVRKYIEEKVARFKTVRKVVFVDMIPKLPSGKIRRRDLKKYVKNSIGSLSRSSKL